MKMEMIETVISDESMAKLAELVLKAGKERGSFLMQAFASGETVGLYVPAERCAEVAELIDKLITGDGEGEGEDHG